jgi:hypothetical protein
MSSANEPLLPKNSSYEGSYDNNKLIGRMPCATFLLNSNLDTYYKGGIYKNQKNTVIATLVTIPKQLFAKLKGFVDFISYKFKHNINGTSRTFCITFRKKNFTSNSESDIDKYHIRLSLIEKEGENSDNVKCRPKGESMMLKSDGTLEHSEYVKESEDMYVPTSEINKHHFNQNFSSITSGQYSSEISEVKDMVKITEDKLPRSITDAVDSIIKNIDILGKTLVNHCEGNNGGLDTSVSAGGATRRHTRLSRRRKSLFKRKGKKSYKKKKYSKTKKSRRFRRSVRSRR